MNRERLTHKIMSLKSTEGFYLKYECCAYNSYQIHEFKIRWKTPSRFTYCIHNSYTSSKSVLICCFNIMNEVSWFKMKLCMYTGDSLGLSRHLSWFTWAHILLKVNRSSLLWAQKLMICEIQNLAVFIREDDGAGITF